MSSWQVTLALMLRLAQAAVRPGGSATPGPLFGVWLGLSQINSPPWQPTTLMGNVLEANYDGYSRQLVTWFPPWISQGGPEQLAAQDLFFSPSDNLSSNVIGGAFLADAFYGGTLLAGSTIAPPGRVLALTSDALKVQPIFQLPFALIYGAPNLVT